MSLRARIQGALPVTAPLGGQLSVIDIEKLLAVERATVEKGQA
jgi:hypothetical protein